MTVKICGLTSTVDAKGAVEAGADFLGFVFFPASRRCLSVRDQDWVRGVSGAAKVGVFRNQERWFIEQVREAAGLDLVQLHGDEPPALCEALGGPERVVKAIPVGTAVDWCSVISYAKVARILFDSASPRGGGTGLSFDWTLLTGRSRGVAFWLAGGLTPENVAAALATVHPAGVDVASGVELAVGRKDPARMAAFVAAVRAAEKQGSGRSPTASGSARRRAAGTTS